MKIVPTWHTCILRMHVCNCNCIYLMIMPQFRLIAMKLSCDGNSRILLIYSLEEGRHHLFRTILAKYTNPFWQNDCSSIPNSHYKWHRFKTSCGHHDESELKTCLMRARHLFYIQYSENSTSPFDWLLCAVWLMSDWLQITGRMIAEWMMVRSNQSDHSNRSMQSTFSHIPWPERFIQKANRFI